MLILLALDSSTEMCSAVLKVGDATLAREQLAPQQHAELILPMIDQLFSEAGLALSQVDAIAFTRGPGSFMGLRIGTGVVQGLAYGVDKPVIALSSLQVLAQNAYELDGASKVAAAIDARMQALYWGCYELDAEKIMQVVVKDSLTKPSELQIENSEAYWAAGKAWETYAKDLSLNFKMLKPEIYPTARAMLPLATQKFLNGEVITAQEAEPYYIRDQVTHG